VRRDELLSQAVAPDQRREAATSEDQAVGVQPSLPLDGH
jgi:hypothetical protein